MKASIDNSMVMTMMMMKWWAYSRPYLRHRNSEIRERKFPLKFACVVNMYLVLTICIERWTCTKTRTKCREKKINILIGLECTCCPHYFTNDECISLHIVVHLYLDMFLYYKISLRGMIWLVSLDNWWHSWRSLGYENQNEPNLFSIVVCNAPPPLSLFFTWFRWWSKHCWKYSICNR